MTQTTAAIAQTDASEDKSMLNLAWLLSNYEGFSLNMPKKDGSSVLKAKALGDGSALEVSLSASDIATLCRQIENMDYNASDLSVDQIYEAAWLDRELSEFDQWQRTFAIGAGCG